MVLSNPDFYITLSYEEICLFTKTSCSSYPIWLGRNRAIMREVMNYFQKNPPETLYDCLHIIGKFGLSGQGSSRKPDKTRFKKAEKGLDKEQIFW